MKRVIKATTNPYSDDAKRVQSIYHIDSGQQKLASEVYDNLNTKTGYELYFELYCDIVDKGADESILVDLAADFDWDDRLSREFKKLCKENGREDLLDSDRLAR